MSRFPVHNVDDAPTDAQDDLQAMQEAMGKVLNIHGGMAHSPVVLATYRAMGRALTEHGTFETSTREAIALSVGAVDKCDYCQAAHTVAAKRAGFDDDQTLSIRRGSGSGDEKLDALLAVSRQITDEVGYVEDATFRAALDAGWSEEQLAELFAHVAVNLYTNYFNHYAGTELDLPRAPALG